MWEENHDGEHFQWREVFLPPLLSPLRFLGKSSFSFCFQVSVSRSLNFSANYLCFQPPPERARRPRCGILATKTGVFLVNTAMKKLQTIAP